MKGKFSSMWRVVTAVVLALSLSLVMAVPVAAVITDPGGDGTAGGAPKLTVFAPQEVEIETENSYTVTVEDAELLLTVGTDVQTITDAVVINIPKAAGVALWTGTDTIVATLAGTNPERADATINTVIDGNGNVSAIKITVADTDATADTGTTITGVTVTFNSTSTSTEGTYEWTVAMKDDADNTDTGTAEVGVVTEIVPPSIVSVAGTAYQNSNDVIVITFSKEVKPVGTWLEAFPSAASILCGTTALVLTNADFSPAPNGLADTLTITLDEAEAYLVNGTDNLKVTPVANKIEDVNGYKVPSEEKLGDVSGDAVVPTVVLTYSESRPVKDADTLTITATFSEDMVAPEIAIATPGDGDQIVTAMTGSAKVWELVNWDVPTGTDEDGTATVTITGKDLAGNDVGAHTTNTFEIDNTLPTIAVADIVGTTISGAGDEIVITFSEAVTAEDVDWTDRDEFTSILSGTRTLTLNNATIAIDATDTVLTITLNEATDLAYLVNGETITVTLAGGGTGILDAAENEMLSGAENKIEGTTAVSGDVVVPTIVNIVGADTDPDTIAITVSEAVVPDDGTWSSNEFALIENPNGAPININNAGVTVNNDPGADMATIVTITLDHDTTDFAELDITKAICVTPATGAIVDLAGNAVADTEVSSADTTAPTIVSIVGTSIQDAGDTIVITFSEAVEPAEATPVWSANEFTRIEAPNGTDLTLTSAVFSIDGTNTILTITLDEATDGEYLVNGEAVSATPAASAIKDADGNFVAITEVAGAALVDGDVVLPTITSIIGTIIPGSGGGAEDSIRIDFSEAVVPDGAWSEETQLGISNADLASASFSPASGITTTLTITLDTGKDLVAGQTLTVTPVVDKVLDLAGNKMAIDPVPSAQPVNESYAIDLVDGWNLISLPLVESSPNIETVLADLITAGTVSQVRTWVYEAGALDEKTWVSGGPTDLTQMTNGRGYWVEMNAADILVATGLELPAPPATPPAYTVYAGWNLIGFKSLLPTLVENYLGTAVWGTAEIMYGYDAAQGIYTVIQVDTVLVPGCGYWLAVSAEGTVYP